MAGSLSAKTTADIDISNPTTALSKPVLINRILYFSFKFSSLDSGFKNLVLQC